MDQLVEPCFAVLHITWSIYHFELKFYRFLSFFLLLISSNCEKMCLHLVFISRNYVKIWSPACAEDLRSTSLASDLHGWYPSSAWQWSTFVFFSNKLHLFQSWYALREKGRKFFKLSPVPAFCPFLDSSFSPWKSLRSCFLTETRSLEGKWCQWRSKQCLQLS